jgi:hypothetical protein
MINSFWRHGHGLHAKPDAFAGMLRPPADNSLVMIAHAGRRLSVAQWSRQTGIPDIVIRQRIAGGMSPARALRGKTS